jgi:uncharacterized OB-fold protein
MTSLVDTFRAGLARGELLIQSCNACGTAIMYARYRCIACHSADLGWRRASGRGVLHSFTVIRAIPPAGFEDQLPYALGVVKLEEGVQLLARLTGSGSVGDWSGYVCNKPVEFAPANAEEIARRPVPWFRLAGS